MEVIAVSWSKPRWLEINGIRTWTSIIHEPTTSIQLTGDGIEENDLAAHDAPVYVFFQHHYDYWRRKLGLPETAWDWCHWGENITLRTDTYLDETEIHVGDVWQIGADAILQVCGARVPCFKLSWRCGQKDSWLIDLSKTGFSGVYMRIVQAGVVRPGDRAKIIEKSAGPISVARITQLAFENSLKTNDTMNILVRDPNLLSMNKQLFLRKLFMQDDQELLHKNHWTGWRAFRPTRIVDECKGVKSFYLEPADRQALGTYLPGQFATVRLPDGRIKTWTISDFADHANPQYYRITIKKASDNGCSNWMHIKCTTSTKFHLRAPAGSFHLDWSALAPGRQIYLSAGIGITPMLAMLKAHLKHYALGKAPAIWMHVDREAESVPWGLVMEVLDLYRQSGEDSASLRAHVFLTSTSTSSEVSSATCRHDLDLRGTLTISQGRPPPSFLSSLISPSYTINPLNIKPIEIAGPLSTFYICGPQTFEAAMRAELQAVGVPETLIRSESFTSHSTAMSGLPVVAKSWIKFSPAQITVEWTAENKGNVAQSQSLLELAESAGLAPAFGCRAGICGACKVKLTTGSVLGGLQGDGGVLMCSARPNSEYVEIEM